MTNKIKQNKKHVEINEQIIIAPVFFILCVILLITLCSINVSAAGINNKELVAAPYINTTSANTEGLYFATRDYGNAPWYAWTNETDYNAYVVVGEIGSSHPILICSYSSGTVYTYNSYDGVSSRTLSTIDSNTNLYYSYIWGTTIRDIQVPIYSATSSNTWITEVLNQVVNDIPSDPGPTPHSLDITLPTGTIAFIEVPTDSTTYGYAESTTRKGFSSPYTDSRTAGYSNTLPSSSFDVPISGHSSINWVGNGNPSLFGLYTKWYANFTISGSSNNKYFVITNPSYPQDEPDYHSGAAVTNNAINLHIDDAYSYRIYSLTSSWDNGKVVTDSGSNSYWDGDYNSDTGLWDSTPSDPSIGNNPIGGNAIQAETTIHDWLENISNTISGFFNGAIGAVTNLVSSGSSFINVLTGLYSWLPSSVLSVLTSALIIVITIGVIKVFI